MYTPEGEYIKSPFVEMSSEFGIASNIEPMKNLPNEDSPKFSKEENSPANEQENFENYEEGI